ncbi:Uncharacterised nucleotidyltransferase [Microbacterium sp. cf046]|uniref:nucleotidyltransferase family protein n=1 Tax=Microbacterium sp. cf046 TaxID=1761803 RepID=UPI0008EED065|nr:nucleotidyltransferase family protein [Microbacterium sp. cf046]SFR90856.1 Uncharacterised nucleotidyltransferase [Microbacterium sp. cf046]
MNDHETAIPLGFRLRLGRAAVQTIAERAGADVLHIKGDAVYPELRPHMRSGSDIDILVRPAHVAAIDRALRAYGWTVYSTFVNGSPFGHAQTYSHAVWGYVDVHRLFPGIGLDPGDAFARLWQGRGSMEFAGKPCPVPGRTEQATVLVLNAARGRSDSIQDLRSVWFDATVDDRARIESLVAELDARTAFDAALGQLDRHRGEPDYRLWKAVSENGTRLEEWRGRLGAAPTLRLRALILLKAPMVNVEHLGHELGRTPTRREIVREFFARPVRGLREARARRR